MKEKIILFFATLAIIFSTTAQVMVPVNEATGVVIDAEVSVTLDQPVIITQGGDAIILPEQELNKSLFQELALPSDEPSAYGMTLPMLWDGVTAMPNGFHTESSTWPQWVTIDLGKTIKLTKFRYWQRLDPWTFGFDDRSVKKMEIWGSVNPNPDGSWDNSWILLNTIESGTTSIGQDQARIAEGEEFAFSSDIPPVRYIRLKVLETWNGTEGGWHMMEMALWGSEPVVAGVTIKDAANNPVADVKATVNDKKITISHAAFAKSTTYTVTIPVTSIQGLSEDITWSFTTATADVEVINMTPNEGATGIETDATLMVTMNKPIDVLQTTLMPDEDLDKDLFKELSLPGDEPSAYGWMLPTLWDGIAAFVVNEDPHGFHTNSANWPQWITIDLGQTVKLTKFRYWQRLEDFYPNPADNLYGFDNRNVKKMEIYGSTNPNSDGSWDNWHLLTTATSGTTSIEQNRDLISEGEEFELPSNATPVRYIRIKVLETWDGSIGAWFMMEVTFWGAPATIAGVSIKDASNNEVTGVIATVEGEKITINHDELTSNTEYTVVIPKESIQGLEENITWSFKTKTGSGIENPNEEPVVFPTISNGDITINAPIGATITIIDIAGQILNTYKSMGKESIPLNYSNGLYIITIENKGVVTAHKVILKRS